MIHKNIIKKINDVFLNQNSYTFFVFCTLILSLITLIPGSIFFSVSGIAVEQWANLTNQMFFGQEDFLFSYGPLRWLTIGGSITPYNVISYFITVFFITLYFAFFWTLLFRLVLKNDALFLLLAIFIFVIHSLLCEAIFFLLPVVILFFIEFLCKDRRKIVNNLFCVLAGALSVLLLFIRFPYGVAAILTFGGYLFSLSFIDKSDYKKFLLYLISFFIFYILFGIFIFHNKSSLYYYLFINYQLSFSNSIEMVEDVRVNPICWIFVLLIFIIQNYSLWEKKVLLFPLSLLFYILLKWGLSRIDHMGGMFILPMSIVLFLIVFSKKKYAKCLYTFTLLLLFSLVKFSPVPGVSPLKFIPILTNYQQYREPYADRMAYFYANYKLDDAVLKKLANKSVDVYPYVNQIIFANYLKYHYRPSFQSYMTLTPKLDQLNQRYLSGQGHPDFILWTGTAAIGNDFGDVDGRYILSEDPLTTSTILLNYHVVDRRALNNLPILVLQHNDTPYKLLVFSFIGLQDMQFNKWINVPQGYSGVIKLIPNFRLTFYARLKNMLFWGDDLYISYKLKNGNVYNKYRVNILNAQNGIWISPYVNNLSFSHEDVSQIMFTNDHPFYFGTSFQGKWLLTNISIKNFLK